MHYEHVIALAQMRHQEHQEYARRAPATAARRPARRWRRLRRRLIPTSSPLPSARGTRVDAGRVDRAV